MGSADGLVNAAGSSVMPAAAQAAPTVAGAGAPAAGGFIDKFTNFMSGNKLWGPAIQTGGLMIASAANNTAQAQQLADQRAYNERMTQQQRDLYNKNMNVSGIRIPGLINQATGG